MPLVIGCRSCCALIPSLLFVSLCRASIALEPIPQSAANDVSLSRSEDPFWLMTVRQRRWTGCSREPHAAEWVLLAVSSAVGSGGIVLSWALDVSSGGGSLASPRLRSCLRWSALSPPQIPKSSSLSSANCKHSSLTSHRLHIARAASGDLPGPMKKMFVSTSLQAAFARHASRDRAISWLRVVAIHIYCHIILLFAFVMRRELNIRHGTVPASPEVSRPWGCPPRLAAAAPTRQREI